jgi:hypothetical protein
MLTPATRWFLVLITCVFAGCGPASGIQPGIPSETTAPINPTPDMDPSPPATPARK